jgi:hypothetical protein
VERGVPVPVRLRLTGCRAEQDDRHGQRCSPGPALLDDAQRVGDQLMFVQHHGGLRPLGVAAGVGVQDQLLDLRIAGEAPGVRPEHLAHQAGQVAAGVPGQNTFAQGQAVLEALGRRVEVVLVGRVGQYEPSHQLGVVERDQLGQQAAPAVPGDHDGPPAARRLEHGGEVADLAVQAQRRDRVAVACARPVVSDHPGSSRYQRHDPGPGQ